jgi:hypothetical protein
MSDVPEVQISAAMDYTAAYKVIVLFDVLLYIVSHIRCVAEIYHLQKDAYAGGTAGERTCHRWRIYSCQ